MKVCRVSKRVHFRKLCFILVASALVSCVPPAGQPESGVPTSSAGSIVGVVDDSKGFRIDVCQTVTGNASGATGEAGKCNQGKFYIHKKGDRSTACEVSKSLASADLECEAEAHELDLAFSGIHFAYNVPSSMCDYFRVYPYFFWNDRAGSIPSPVSYELDRDTGRIISDSLTGFASVAEKTEWFNASTGTFSCPYDTSAKTPPGPNCCQGKMSKSITSVDTTLSKGESFSVTINTVPTSGPLAANVKYFRFATAIRNTAVASIATDSIDKKYFVWLNDGGVATAPTVSGYQAIEVVYRSTATATATEPADTTVTLAGKIANAIALNVGSQATVTQASNVVSVSMTRAFDAENVADGATATGFGLQRVDGQVTTKVETTSTEYSGKLGNCLKGPATITQAKDNSGIPMTTLYDVSGSGKSGVYSADKSMALATRVNAVNSNFYTATDHTGGKPKGFITSAGVTPNEYYEFVCLDRAEEVIARIRVKVREWNTAKLFVNYRDASGTPSVSDVQSTDASNCSGTFATDASCVDNASLNDVKNDYKDWKDFVDAYPELRENI